MPIGRRSSSPTGVSPTTREMRISVCRRRYLYFIPAPGRVDRIYPRQLAQPPPRHHGEIARGWRLLARDRPELHALPVSRRADDRVRQPAQRICRPGRRPENIAVESARIFGPSAVRISGRVGSIQARAVHENIFPREWLSHFRGGRRRYRPRRESGDLFRRRGGSLETPGSRGSLAIADDKLPPGSLDAERPRKPFLHQPRQWTVSGLHLSLAIGSAGK